MKKIESEIFNAFKIPKELINDKPSNYDSAKANIEVVEKKEILVHIPKI